MRRAECLLLSHRGSLAETGAAVPTLAPRDLIRQPRPHGPREVEILGALATGESNKESARRLGISPNTVKTHVSRVYHKLGVRRRVQAIEKARLRPIARRGDFRLIRRSLLTMTPVVAREGAQAVDAKICAERRCKIC